MGELQPLPLRDRGVSQGSLQGADGLLDAETQSEAISWSSDWREEFSLLARLLQSQTLGEAWRRPGWHRQRASNTRGRWERKHSAGGLLDKELFFLRIFELLSFVNIPTLRAWLLDDLKFEHLLNGFDFKKTLGVVLYLNLFLLMTFS